MALDSISPTEHKRAPLEVQVASVSVLLFPPSAAVSQNESPQTLLPANGTQPSSLQVHGTPAGGGGGDVGAGVGADDGSDVGARVGAPVTWASSLSQYTQLPPATVPDGELPAQLATV